MQMEHFLFLISFVLECLSWLLAREGVSEGRDTGQEGAHHWASWGRGCSPQRNVWAHQKKPYSSYPFILLFVYPQNYNIACPFSLNGWRNTQVIRCLSITALRHGNHGDNQHHESLWRLPFLPFGNKWYLQFHKRSITKLFGIQVWRAHGPQLGNASTFQNILCVPFKASRLRRGMGLCCNYVLILCKVTKLNYLSWDTIQFH